NSFAINIPGYEGGIQNETIYKEVIFVTGEPIIMEGTLTIKTKEKNNIITETYTYKLENKAYDAKLSRSITLKETLEPNGQQIKSTKILEKYKETINIGRKRYEVKDSQYQWNQGTIVHNTPLLSYYAGDFSARKTYDINKGEESLVVESVGYLVGYNSPWSSTQTQTIDYILNYENKLTEDTWQGTATVESSFNKTKDYSYAENIPSQISFNGGYRITEKEENILKYSYDLPRIVEGIIVKGRNIGTESLSLDTNPIIERLNIPALRDVLGHEYEEDLLLLASMEGLPLNHISIGPNSPMTRGDFARLIVKSMGIEIVKEEPKKTGKKKVEQPEPTFIDVDIEDKNFDYIEEVNKRNIMVGIEEDIFAPEAPLTRIEAYTVVSRILGLQSLVPIGNYSLGYRDEASIPSWAKGHVYICKELGLIEESDYLYPNRYLTKGEAAKLIVNLINYMQEELRYDYMEGILNN
ncbi:MAG: hypothetical protein GXY96_07615, partial [Tissierellia bacterium]|nr:hypothetical protein [Tissierellia bacterium]